MVRLRMLRAVFCMMLWVVTVNSPGQTQSLNLQELGKQLAVTMPLVVVDSVISFSSPSKLHDL